MNRNTGLRRNQVRHLQALVETGDNVAVYLGSAKVQLRGEVTFNGGYEFHHSGEQTDAIRGQCSNPIYLTLNKIKRFVYGSKMVLVKGRETQVPTEVHI